MIYMVTECGGLPTRRYGAKICAKFTNLFFGVIVNG